MLAIAIPGFRDLEVEHLVLDYNGTLAIDGRLIPGVREALGALAVCFTNLICLLLVHFSLHGVIGYL